MNLTTPALACARRAEEAPAAEPQTASGRDGPPTSAAPSPQQEQQQQQQQQERQPSPAAPSPPASAPGAQRKKPGGGGGGGGAGRALTQMHLDAGQRDFHLSRCAVCGLVYAPGEPSDERLHAAHHASATKGLRYQPWPGEREVLADGAAGRVVAVPCGGSGRRNKKVRAPRSAAQLGRGTGRRASLTGRIISIQRCAGWCEQGSLAAGRPSCRAPPALHV